MLKRILLLCGVAFGLTGCSLSYQNRTLPEWIKGSSLPAPQWSAGVSSELATIIRKRCAPLLAKGKFMGLSVVLVSGTNTAVMGFGRATLSSDEPVNENTLFEIGSITKTFTALGLAREIVREHLHLEQKLQEILPAGLELPPAARQVTLQHLTTHTSGFPPQPANLSFWHVMKKLFSGKNPYADYSEAQFLQAIHQVKLQSKPGTRFEYSNFGVDVLGYALSRRAGTNYEQWVKTEVCEPLGLRDTTITLAPGQSNRFASGYLLLERKRAVLKAIPVCAWDLPDYIAASGGLRSSAAEMARYLDANMHPEGPLGEAIRLSHRQLFQSEDEDAVAMNWIRTSYQHLGTVIWHNGETGGYSSYMGFTADGRAGVVLLSNVAEESIDELGVGLLRDALRANQTMTNWQ